MIISLTLTERINVNKIVTTKVLAASQDDFNTICKKYSNMKETRPNQQTILFYEDDLSDWCARLKVSVQF